MRPISAAMLDAITGSHGLAVRVRVVEPGQTGSDPVGIEFDGQLGDPGEIGVHDSGSITFDATADVWGTLDLDTALDGWDPRPGRHPLQPYGNEIFVERGVDYGGGLTDYVPLGYYKLYDVREDQAGSGVLSVQAQDRMQTVIEGILTAPVQFTAATSVQAVFDALVREVLPDVVISFEDSEVAASTIGRMIVVEEDRHALLRELVTAHGQVMHFDHEGKLIVKPPPPITSPVWDVEAGEDGVLVSASRAINREGVYNAVVVTGEGGDDTAPVRVVVIDSNPTSPTHYNGPYGKVPMAYSSSLVTTWNQATSAGRAMLQRLLGLPYYVDFSSVPNPALEPFDVVRVRYSTSAARETHVVRSVVIPLTATEPLTASTRESSSVLISTETTEEAAA